MSDAGSLANAATVVEGVSSTASSSPQAAKTASNAASISGSANL
jgi:hypothetical protein